MACQHYCRPGMVREIVPVGLDRPRDFTSMKDPEFHEAMDKVRSLLKASGMTE